MRYICNAYNSSGKHAVEYIMRHFGANAVAYEKRWLAGKIIGEPQATDAYTVVELKAMDIVGVYIYEFES